MRGHITYRVHTANSPEGFWDSARDKRQEKQKRSWDWIIIEWKDFVSLLTKFGSWFWGASGQINVSNFRKRRSYKLSIDLCSNYINEIWMRIETNTFQKGQNGFHPMHCLSQNSRFMLCVPLSTEINKSIWHRKATQWALLKYIYAALLKHTIESTVVCICGCISQIV